MVFTAVPGVIEWTKGEAIFGAYWSSGTQCHGLVNSTYLGVRCAQLFVRLCCGITYSRRSENSTVRTLAK